MRTIIPVYVGSCGTHFLIIYVDEPIKQFVECYMCTLFVHNCCYYENVYVEYWEIN